MFQATTALRKLQAQTKRIRIVQGGTSAGKTIAILLMLIQMAQTERLAISVVSESMPHLKRGTLRDFLNIMTTHNYYKAANHDRTNNIYHFPETGSYIEFFSADDPAKLRGARRDVLFINEANNISYFAYEQLEVRTKKLVIIDFNPVSEFWAHTEVMPRVDHDFIILTYRDNEGLDEQIIASIESRKDKPNWWRVYGEGQIGFNEGQIYPDWEPLEQIPAEARKVRHGLDFGFTNDPSAIVDIYEWNDAIILDEVLYRTGQSNRDLASAIRGSEGLGHVDEQNHFTGYCSILTIGDSAEPKSIAEIKNYGVRITGSQKGQGSVMYGIQLVQQQKIYLTKRSLNLWTENRNYLWRVDKDGKSLNVPEEGFDHGMDAARYAIVDIKGKRNARVFTSKPRGL